MTSFFDRQTNCLTEPERELVWSFLLLSLDPIAVGMPTAAYDAAWAGLGEFGAKREEVFRDAFALNNVHIDPFDFVVTGISGWFLAWADSISTGDSNPSGACPCDGL